MEQKISGHNFWENVNWKCRWHKTVTIWIISLSKIVPHYAKAGYVGSRTRLATNLSTDTQVLPTHHSDLSVSWSPWLLWSFSHPILATHSQGHKHQMATQFCPAMLLCFSSIATDWIFVSPQNPSVEILTPNVIVVLGAGPLGGD